MGSIGIRRLLVTDPPVFEAAFAAQGWQKAAAQYERYLALQESGERDVLVATTDGAFAGYLTIGWESEYPPFRAEGIPEIVDFNVLQKYQRQGMGTALMDEAERRIATRSPMAGIGVGLTPDYGPAQILYARRGYIPDGRGLDYDGQILTYGMPTTVDDSLVLHLTKRLTSPPSPLP
jgi:ribosomal protein S18 acetylase RimI-like enzyme